MRGGSERVMLDESECLTEIEHEVVHFSRQNSNNYASSYSHFFPSNINYSDLNVFKKIQSAINIVYSRQSKNYFNSFVNITKPNIIHGHNIYSGLTYSIVDVAKKYNIPFVLTLHDLKLACPSYLMLNNGKVCERCLSGNYWNCTIYQCHKKNTIASFIVTIEAYFNKLFRKYEWIDSFICPSRFLIEKVSSAGFLRDKLVYLPNALNPQAYVPSYGAGEYALFVGRLSHEKGLITLLKAFQDIAMPLKIAGTGPLDEQARSFVRDNNLSHIGFEGYCSGDNLSNLYKNAAFIVVPSECYENAPMCILESFAYGKPVIGANIGGIPELVIDGDTGLLFESGSHESLRSAVTSLWGQTARIDKMGHAARNRIENEFSSARHVQKLIDIYESAIFKKR
ncbi:glycosyltransferase family 4 protein [Desulfomicrobium apsheronum]|nr:glycosyltransferase family 4 protein [Desulfomicrobium apsheronum]